MLSVSLNDSSIKDSDRIHEKLIKKLASNCKFHSGNKELLICVTCGMAICDQCVNKHEGHQQLHKTELINSGKELKRKSEEINNIFSECGFSEDRGNNNVCKEEKQRINMNLENLQKNNAEMWAFEMPYNIERVWTKRDAFILLCLDSSFYYDSPQYMASIQIYRKSKFTEKFLEDLLYYSSDKRIITDNPNTLGKNNYEGFKENRHDQSVFSLLIKKYGLVNTAKTNMITNNTKIKIRMPFIFCHFRR